ncbi:MAG: hypothetical protein OHK0046_23150 [Anaerolineae bacterium]
MLAGALVVIATFTYPLWRPAPVPAAATNVQFPELSEAEQQAFANLPPNVQRLYGEMRLLNAPMAVDLLSAHLMAGEPLPAETQALPPVDSAEQAASGTFTGLSAVTLAADDERELPPFSGLVEASGQAIIYQFPDNRKLLRFEEFNVTNGPNLRVVLSTLPLPLTEEELLQDRFRIDLGPLKSVVGPQNYENVPVEINPVDYNSVVIYENTYGIIFAVARL